MSVQGKLGTPVMMLGGITYLIFLCVALIWWHMAPQVVLALTVGGVALLAIALNPYLGVHAFLMSLPFENLLSLGEGLTGMKLIGVVIVAGWLISMAVRRDSVPRFNSLALTMVLFVAWCGASLIYALDATVATSRLFTFAQLVLIACMFASVVNSPARLRGVFWAMVLWTFVSTVVAVAGYYLGMTSAAVGLVGNKNALAGSINVAIICAYLLHQSTTNAMSKAILASTLPVFFLGLALTFSRAGLITLIGALLVVWYRIAREKGFLILLGSAAALTTITLLLPETFFKRAGTIVPAIERQQDTVGLRVRLWKVGLRMIGDRPVFGVGPGNFTTAYPRYSQGQTEGINFVSHNAYVGVAAETGIVGLGLFLLIHLYALGYARRAIVAGRGQQMRDLGLLAVAAEVAIVATMIGGVAGNTETVKQLWIFFGLAGALGDVALRVASARQARAGSSGSDVVVEGTGAWSVAHSPPR